jgi:hypothetical protein
VYASFRAHSNAAEPTSPQKIVGSLVRLFCPAALERCLVRTSTQIISQTLLQSLARHSGMAKSPSTD